MGERERILVRGPNWVGDLVMSTPGFRALRAARPDAWIGLQVRQGLEGLVAGAPWFDEVLPIAMERGRIGARWLWREARALRRHAAYDLGICIPESFSSALLMRAAGVERVVGFRRGGRGALLHQPVTAPAEWGRRRLVPRERFVLELLRAIGVETRDESLALYTTQQEEAAVDELLARSDIDAKRPLVALAPGSAYGSAKRWPAESFARVGEALAEAGAAVAIVGAPSEAELAAATSRAMRVPCSNLVGALELGSLKALLRRAQLLVCNDAGARHVAVAFGTPVVALFGPTAVEKTAANLERVSVLATDVECRPCYRRTCPIDHRCMTRISPQRAIDAALPKLGESAARVRA